MLVRNDPVREMDRLFQHVLNPGFPTQPAVMPMDAWRDGDQFVVELDIPGVAPDAVDVSVERNVVTVRAERRVTRDSGTLVASERPRGTFSRQFVLGDNLDTDRIRADYDAGVLRLTVPVAERAKARKIHIAHQAHPARQAHQAHEANQVRQVATAPADQPRASVGSGSAERELVDA